MAQHQHFILPCKQREVLGIYTSCISAADRAKNWHHPMNHRQLMHKVKRAEIN